MTTRASRDEAFIGNILVVTGDPLLVQVVYSALGQRGYRISAVNVSGAKLKKAIQAIKPRVSIVDIAMPVMAGLRTIAHIHTWTNGNTLPVTTWHTGGNALRRLDLRAPCGLSEPFGATELDEWVYRIVEGLPLDKYGS